MGASKGRHTEHKTHGKSLDESINWDKTKLTSRLMRTLQILQRHKVDTQKGQSAKQMFADSGLSVISIRMFSSPRKERIGNTNFVYLDAFDSLKVL